MTSNVCGSIPDVIANREGVYEGNLIRYYQALFTDAANLNHGYHNFGHMLHVTWRCWCACKFYQKEYKEYSGLLSKREMRNLMIAALFHDFDHRGEQGDDAQNISRAVMALQRYILPEDKPYAKKIADIIRATQYPYQTYPGHLTQAIIRDADMMQSFLPAWMQQVVFGLAKEWKEEPITVLKKQIGFLKNLEFYTNWGKETISQNDIAAKIFEVERHIALLEWEEWKPIP